jgi:DNA-binding NarL/FixJ family response regulator
MTIKVIVADDYEVVRRGLRRFLTLDPELEIVGEAANGHEALELARRLKPDVVLMDLIMPGLDGITATTQIRRELPEVEVVALTSVVEDTAVTAMIQAGAIGYILKDSQPAELCQAIKAAAAGQVQLSPQAATFLLLQTRNHNQPAASDLTLTFRETEVLRLIAEGKANKEIAHLLNIGEETVKFHVSNLLDKLGVSSRTQAALYAVNSGIVKPK